MTGTSAATTGMTKNTIRLRSEVSQNEVYRCHSTNVFLNHAQMNPKTVQIDFEWARNLEHPHGGFNFCESCLILAKPGPVGAVSEFAFKISQSSVQLIDAMEVEPPVKPRCETDDGNERRDNRNDKEYDSVEERGQPERRVALPEARAGAVKCLRRWGKRQIIGLLGGKFTEPVKGAGAQCTSRMASSNKYCKAG